jgi:PAS domain S-box-containing protein
VTTDEATAGPTQSPGSLFDEESLRLALDAANMGTWDWNLRTNELKWSDNLEAIHGLAPGTFGGKFEDFQRVVHPDDRDAVRDAIERALGGDGRYDLEFRTLRSDGGVIWLSGKGKVVYGQDGLPQRMVGVGLDVTPRKQLEDALRKADRRKNEFLATLAHELRNPLAPIRNVTELLRLAGDDREQRERALGVLGRQVAQMVRLIDDLLDVSRISQGKFDLRKERIALSTAIESAVEASRPLIESGGHDLSVEISSEPLYVDGDAARLSQVFANLLNNAAKYTDRGRISLRAAPRDGRAVVSVTDTGVGIAASELPHIFEMFAQADGSLQREQGGLGIGLSLVRALVAMHDGAVSARSEGRGKGSEFTVELPLTP